MKYIVKLNNGLGKVIVSLKGSNIELYEGQEVSEVIAKSFPRFVKAIDTKSNKEEIITELIEEPKEEILTEISSDIEVEVIETPKKKRKSKKTEV